MSQLHEWPGQSGDGRLRLFDEIDNLAYSFALIRLSWYAFAKKNNNFIHQFPVQGHSFCRPKRIDAWTNAYHLQDPHSCLVHCYCIRPHWAWPLFNCIVNSDGLLSQVWSHTFLDRNSTDDRTRCAHPWYDTNRKLTSTFVLIYVQYVVCLLQTSFYKSNRYF